MLMPTLIVVREEKCKMISRVPVKIGEKQQSWARKNLQNG